MPNIGRIEHLLVGGYLNFSEDPRTSEIPYIVGYSPFSAAQENITGWSDSKAEDSCVYAWQEFDYRLSNP